MRTYDIFRHTTHLYRDHTSGRWYAVQFIASKKMPLDLLYIFCFFLTLASSAISCTPDKSVMQDIPPDSWLLKEKAQEEILADFLSPLNGKIRPLICLYDSSGRVTAVPIEMELTPDGYAGAAEMEGSAWDVQIVKESVTDTRMKLKTRFSVRQGTLEHAGVALAFDFDNWTTDNYVFVPAAAYNGNRFDVLSMPYPPHFKDKAYQKIDLPVTITDVPGLAKGPGVSRMELLATDASTPAAGFYRPDTGWSFLLLTSVGTNLGYNGIIVEESADRKHASLVISAPGVRQMRSGGTRLVPSSDIPASFTTGDVVQLEFLIDVFRSNSIPEYLMHFFSERKGLTGLNTYEHRTPFSMAFTMEEALQNDLRWYERGPYYKNGNGDSPYGHIQVGWVGGLMQPYPLLLAGGPDSRRRSLTTLATAFERVQGPSGFFYGLYRDGKVYGDNFEDMEEVPEIAMVRKNADALFYLSLEFDLLRERGEEDLIAESWKAGLRKLADAFVGLWQRYGQFGQLVDVHSGEIVVGGSTAPAIAPAGLALASRYFGDSTYLKVAGQAAALYYERDVVRGYTTGGPGEILQNPDSESAIAMLESFMTLYETTGDTLWVDRAEDIAALFASWVVSYDFDFPETSVLGKCDARSTGAVWASTQNNHAAPGVCTSSGDALLRLYRATGNRLYMDLLKDISHNILEFMSTEDRPVGNNINGYINERVNISDWEGVDGRGWVHESSVSWCEMSVLLTTVEIPSVYIQPDREVLYVFDHIEVRPLGKDTRGWKLEFYNPTRYAAVLSILSESEEDLKAPLPRHLYRRMPRVHLDAGERKKLYF